MQIISVYHAVTTFRRSKDTQKKGTKDLELSVQKNPETESLYTPQLKGSGNVAACRFVVRRWLYLFLLNYLWLEHNQALCRNPGA